MPPLTLEAVEPTVLNCFLFRQTDLILRIALPEKHNAARFQPAAQYAENKVLFSFRSRHAADTQMFFGDLTAGPYTCHSVPRNSRCRRAIPSGAVWRSRTTASIADVYCGLLSITNRPGERSRVVKTA